MSMSDVYSAKSRVRDSLVPRARGLLQASLIRGVVPSDDALATVGRLIASESDHVIQLSPITEAGPYLRLLRASEQRISKLVDDLRFICYLHAKMACQEAARAEPAAQ